MLNQRRVDKLCEALLVVGQHLSSLLKGEALRAVAAVVRHMAAGLIGEQLDFHFVIHRILQEIYDISVVCDGNSLFSFHIISCQTEGLLGALRDQADPALTVSCLNAGVIHLSDNAHASGDLNGLRLSAAHAAQTAGDEQMAGQVSVVGNAQEFPACV